MKNEEDLIELKKKNIEHTKRLLALEWVLMLISLTAFLVMIYIGIEVVTDIVWQIALVMCSIIILMTCVIFAIYIEQVAGYYECRKCKHRYIPTYLQVLIAMHYGRTRYMKCPKCHNRSWNKKVLTK